MNFKVYSLLNCPRCVVLKTKLKNKNIDFEEITSEDVLLEKGYTMVPVLEVDDTIYNFAQAVKFLENLEV